jgi:hypothetical protein
MGGSAVTAAIESDPDVCGFPGHMLGAYLAGLVAEGDASCVTLHKPVAGGAVLHVDKTTAQTTIRWDFEVVATVDDWDPADIAVPPFVAPVDVDGPVVADVEQHPVPGCYVCGPSGAGLRLDFRVPDGMKVVCARWRPDGQVTNALAWAVLDCPGFWALTHDVPTGTHVVSRSLRGAVHRPIERGREYVIVGAPLGQQGRSVQVTAAVFEATGELCAVVDQTLFTTSWGFPLAALTR